jgi:3',5'-cyclic AMP phosphodiesterase CpdA
LAHAVAEFVYTERNGLDAIIITGDLATTGLPADLLPAERYVTEACTDKWLTSRQAPSLASHDLPIFLIPGNHDRYQDEVGTPVVSDSMLHSMHIGLQAPE